MKPAEPPGTGATAPAPPVAADAEPRGGVRGAIDRALAIVPQVLSSHAHIVFLVALGVWLIVLPIAGVHVSSKVELIGGNYTNVTSDIAASIAAGLTVKIHHDRRVDRMRMEQLHASLERLHDRVAGAGSAHGGVADSGVEHRRAPLGGDPAAPPA